MSVRLLVVPGLQDSGPAHWQSWLQGQYRDSLRVRQRDWTVPDLERWAARIAATGWKEIYAYFMHEPTAPAYSQDLMKFGS